MLFPGRKEKATVEDRYANLDLQRTMDTLSNNDRAVIILKYFEDRKLDEIAQILDENINTVKSRLYRSLKNYGNFWKTRTATRQIRNGKIRTGGSMIYNFSEQNNLNENVEKKLLLMKDEYQSRELSAIQREKLLKSMEEIEKMNQTETSFHSPCDGTASGNRKSDRGI